MIRRIYRITLLILAIGVSCFSHATEETYSVRRSAEQITVGASFEVIDGRFGEIGLDHFKDKETRFLVKFGIEEREHYGYFATEATIDAKITIEALGPLGETLTTKTEHLIIEYNPSDGLNTIDLDAVLDGGHHRYRVTINDLTGVATIPDYVFLEAELQIDRFYELDRETVPTIATVFTAYDTDNNELKHHNIERGTRTNTYLGEPTLAAQEIELFWAYIEGAEEYELEWTWVDNYNQDDFGTVRTPEAIPFSERDFELNNTRIITQAQTYRIPLIYAKGYLIYRVRAVGRWTDNDLQDTDKLLFGPWSSDTDEEIAKVSNWEHFIEISSDHEAIKNWQYQAVFAEEGKKKEIVSYFDGSLRNRQTVTRINSNNEAIVGENVYDNQGRSAVQILPTPVENAALRYYVDLNKSEAEGNPVYTHKDFDWNAIDGDCIAGATGMNNGSGASKYYSPNNDVSGNWQDYVPDAEKFPFVQVEYTPDNTGRIRRQSGVGADYTISGGRATEYFYMQPLQSELNRLFGPHIGNVQHYKKNLVIDANGQVSISYIDPQGRVVATALAGDNTGLAGETLTNLISLQEHGDGDTDDGVDDPDHNHITVTEDLLNKLNAGAIDTDLDNNHKYISGKQGASYDALRYNAQYASVDEQVHKFEYSVTTGLFEDDCSLPGVAYPFAYNLSLDIKDDCGESLLAYDHDDNPESATLNGVQTLVSGTVGVNYIGSTGTTLTLGGTSLTALLESGGYSLNKYIEVNPDTLEKHLAHYLDNLKPECIPEFFHNNVDCEGDEYPDVIDGEPVFSDFDLTTCNISIQTMISDLMPGGQYGGTDPDDRTSIFHLENVLAQGSTVDLDENWQNIPVNADGEILEYRDENGDLSYVEVELGDSPGDCVPALVEGYVLTIIDGVDYVKPQYLANASDFIANWEGTWAISLVPYHPEYEYYQYHYKPLCENQYPGTIMIEEEGGPVVAPSSETYNLALQFITTFEAASTASNPFLTPLVPSSGANHPIKNLDPYFNLTYGHLEILNDATTYEGSSVNTYKNDLIDEIIAEYKNNNLGIIDADDDFDLWEYAVKIVACGSDFAADCDLGLPGDPDGLYPGTGGLFDGLSTEQQDQIWNTYKQFYLAEKRKIDQILLDSYTIRKGFFNGYIGASEPEGINLGSFVYYGTPHMGYGAEIGLNAIYLDAIVEEGYDDGDAPFAWFDNEEVGLFAEKIKRFEPIYGLYDAGLPEDGGVLVEDMEEMADATIYTSTGQCGMLRDAENFLRGLSENNLLFNGAIVNSNDFPWLTGDLYEGMNGEEPITNPIDINVTIVSGDLSVRVLNGATGSFFKADGITPMRPINIDAPDPGGLDFVWDWDDVTKLRMMYYEPESQIGGVYQFQILAELAEVSVDGELVYREVVLNGNTKIEIGDCFLDEEDLEEPLCDRDENFANNIRAIFTELYNPSATGGDFALHTNVDASTVLGGWYAGSEFATQLGDNPVSPQTKLTSTLNSFTLGLLDLERTIEVIFPTLPLSGITLVTGASYDADANQVTLYYIDDTGIEGTIVGTVTDEEGTSPYPLEAFLNLDCMCDEEAELSAAFVNLFNELMTVPFFPETAPFYSSEATEFLSGLAGEEVGVKSFNPVLGLAPSDGFSFVIQGQDEESFVQCTFKLDVVGDYLTEEVDNIHHVELHVTEGEPDHVDMIVYGTLNDGTIIRFERDLSASFGSESGGCFREIGCGCSHPATLAPQSCTEQLTAYNEEATTWNDALALLPEYADEDELYDASFPILEQENFCGTRLAYAVQAYLAYLTELEVNSTEDDNYITLATFAITGLNNYYLDELQRDITDSYWEEGTNGKIDPIEMYDLYVTAALGADEPYLSWNDYVDGIYLTEQKICPPNPLPYYPTYDFTFPCEEWTANTDTVNAKNQEEIYLEKLADNFRRRYVDEAISSLVETFEATYFDKEYHYTLYYYDQAGNLIQTVPPKGIDRQESGTLNNDVINKNRQNLPLLDEEETALDASTPQHSFETKYLYNSLNQLVWQSTPDGGQSYFGYDELGRLVVSQNAKQAAYIAGQEQFSYTRYDELGRIIEVGEMTLGADFGFDENGRFIDPVGVLVNVSSLVFPSNLGDDLYEIEEVTKTQYDQLIGMDPGMFKDYSFDNTRNRITGVYYYETYFDGDVYLAQDNYDNATFYDYDVHGNVKELIQDNNDEQLKELEQDTKKVEYEYDLVSGNVKHVTYQKDKVDQFIHEYEYDSDNRITNVRTSHDNVLWEQDAKYFYYNHGPLARTEIGDKKVQSNDFAYTTQGWLKGVNSEDLDANNDQGKDGRYGTSGTNKMNGKDVFGYSLHYFDDDYNARFANDFLVLSASPLSFDHNKNLYNGNISEMYTASTNTDEEYIGTSHTWYNYDQLNRIIDMNQEHLFGGDTPENRYKSHYAYDSNGNLDTLKRSGWDGAAMIAIDDFKYHYIAETANNQLGYVSDAEGEVMAGFDLANQSAGNYTYDEIGQLIRDNQEDIIDIQWKVTGKVHKIIWGTISDKDNLEFIYDAMGNRIQKIMTYDNGTVDKTYYMRDAQGNCMSIYTLSKTGELNGTALYDLKLTERSIYGSSRVGTENPEGLVVAKSDASMLEVFPYERNVGDKRYELSNHLGNVLQVVTDRKLAVDDNTYDEFGVFVSAVPDGEVDYYIADVVSQSDYYPFGMLMANTNVDPVTGDVIAMDNDYRYSFQGQEKDDEIKGDNNSINYKYRMHDPRVGRFFAVDPLAASFPYNGPYNFSENRVVDGVELEGLEVISIHGDGRASLMITGSYAGGIMFDFEGNVAAFSTFGLGGGVALGVSGGGGISIAPTADNIYQMEGWGASAIASAGFGGNIEFTLDWAVEDPNNHASEILETTKLAGTVTTGVGGGFAFGAEGTYTWLTAGTWSDLADWLDDDLIDLLVDDASTFYDMRSSMGNELSRLRSQVGIKTTELVSAMKNYKELTSSEVDISQSLLDEQRSVIENLTYEVSVLKSKEKDMTEAIEGVDEIIQTIEENE